jgi:transposase
LIKIFHPNIIGGNKIGKNIKFSNGKVYIKGILELCKKKLIKSHRISKDNFIYCLKELKFKYNFRDNIDDSLYNCLGGLNLGIIYKNIF